MPSRWWFTQHRCDVVVHHHQEHAPSWSVAISTVRFHRSRSWARRQADTKPMLSGRKSCSMVRSQVRRGRPGGRFQSRSSPEMMDRRTRVWSNLLSALAIWPKKRRRCCCTAQIQHWWCSSWTTTMCRCGPVTYTIWSITWISEVPFTEFVISFAGLFHGDCRRFIFALQYNSLFAYLVLINYSTSSAPNIHKCSVCNILSFISVTQQTKKLLCWMRK